MVGVTMKGITPIIAIILLLLITISLVGFAFIYFTRITEYAGQQTQQQLEDVLLQQQQVVRIDNVVDTGPNPNTASLLALRAIGSASVPESKISVYVGSTLYPCDLTQDPIPSGQVATCTIAVDCAGSQVRVTTPGGVDARDCTT